MRRDFDPAHLRDVYDGLAATYAASRGSFDNAAQLEALARLLPPRARVLDLGCGTGLPVARFFADRGHQVTGIDLAPHMVERARRNVPGARFEVANVAGYPLAAASWDLVVSFYALFHLSRAAQERLFPRVAAALAPGGHLYATFADREWTGAESFEGSVEFEGVALPYAQLSPAEYRAALERSGFHEVRSEKLTIGGETMLWVLCRVDG